MSMTESSSTNTSPLAAAAAAVAATKGVPSTSGETSLDALLSGLEITIHPETYVFATVPASLFNGTGNGTGNGSAFPIPLSDILLFFREPCTTGHHDNIEGNDNRAQDDAQDQDQDDAQDQITLILQRDVAERYAHEYQSRAEDCPLTYTYPSRLLTCNIHSSLSAVGFMAALATRLAERGISVNPVAGFFHDHLFVPVERADEAARVLLGKR